jgi:hypothetical protein
VPISESDNVDVIALRAAISILQLQHQSAERDIQALQKLKSAALEDPEGYVKELVRRVNANPGGMPGGGPGGGGGGGGGRDLLAPTVANLVAALGDGHELLRGEEGEEAQSQGAMRQEPKAERESGDVEMRDAEAGASDDSDEEESADQQSKFPKPPAAQNVYRMPPINWAKYHVVGGALDKLHEEQRKRPTPGQVVEGNDRPEEYVMAAPYAPVVDAARLAAGNESEHPMVTRRGGKRVGSR